MPISCSINSTGIKGNMDDVLSPVLYVLWIFVALAFEPWCRDDFKGKKVGTTRSKYGPDHCIGNHKGDQPCAVSQHRRVPVPVPIYKASSEENGAGQYPVWMTQKPRKGDFRELKSKKFPGRAFPWTLLEACAFGARSGNRSPFILDPRLKNEGTTTHNHSTPLP